MLDTLQDKVDRKHAAVLVVDVQNDFCAKDGAYDKIRNDISMYQEMVPRLVKFIDEVRKAGLLIVYTQNEYNSPNNAFLSDVWLEQARRKRRTLYLEVPLCAVGTWGANFYMVKPLTDDPIIRKHRFDAFEGTDLDLVLKSRNIRTLIITGLNTNVCVDTTARHGFVKDYYIVIPRDLVASDSKKLHEVALQNLDTFFGQVVGSEEVLACLHHYPVQRETEEQIRA